MLFFNHRDHRGTKRTQRREEMYGIIYNSLVYFLTQRRRAAETQSEAIYKRLEYERLSI